LKVLIVGAGEAELRLARAGLPAAEWIVEAASVDGDSRAARESLTDLIARHYPDVIYTPSIVPAGLIVAAALSLARQPRPAWLTGLAAFDLMSDYQLPVLADEVASALRSIDGILPFSGNSAEAVAGLGLVARIFPVATPLAALDVDQEALKRSPAGASKVIALDGRHDLLERGQVALAAIRAVARDLRGYEVVVLGAGPDIALAAEVLATDTGLRVAIVPPGATDATAVLDVHTRASASIHVSLAADVGWWEIAALVRGVAPIVSTTSALATDWGREALILPVDPEDPRAIGTALTRIVNDDELAERARATNTDFARMRFSTATAAGRLAGAIAAVAAMARDR
jgi:glycosyltransferase involved in cell wall biosynthesis